MSINERYRTIKMKLEQLRPNERITRLRAFGWLMAGIHACGSVHLSKVANRIPGEAVTGSKTRRMERIVDNQRIDVREWYAPIAKQWLRAAAQTVGEIRLILDSTKIGFGYQLLLVSLAFRRRAVPIAWCWLKGPKGHSSAATQVALLQQVKDWLPEGVPVVLVGDTEFEAGEVIQKAEKWDWSYALRQKPNNQVFVDGQWQDFGRLATHPGQSTWLESVPLTLKNGLSTNLLIYWAMGEERPWLLATNLPSRAATLRAYRRRMWIDNSFGDLKSNGFDLESSHLRDAERLSRLTLAVVLLYVWFLAVGQRVIKNGWRPLVDRKDRRDLSIFQIGLRFVERCIANDVSFPFHLFPFPRPKLSGS